jgi:hypothetical protein
MPIEFKRADTTRKPPTRLTEAVWGGEKTGKSTHALSFPDPLYYFNFDWRVQELLDSGDYENREIYLINHVLPSGSDATDLRELRQILEKDFEPQWKEATLQANERGGSVVLDTADELWAIVGDVMTGAVRAERAVRNANENRDAKDSQLDWRTANRFMDTTLKRPVQFPNVNACYIQRAAEKRDNSGNVLGSFMHGFKTTKFIVEVVLKLDIKRTLDAKTQKLTSNFVGVLECSGIPRTQQLVGKEIASPDYETLMAYFS